MCELDGSDKSVPWGARVRHQPLTAAHYLYVADGGMSDDDFAAENEDRRAATAL
jgi:hypothetical protein